MLGFANTLLWCWVISALCLPSVDCGLTCLFGNDLPTPQDGRQVADCGPHETCYLEQYITPAGYVRHKVGCKDTMFCKGSSVAIPNIPVCSQCCQGDLCATNLCGNTGWPSNTGPICYHCDYPVDSPDKCDTINVCGKDEFCGVAAIPGGKYDVKCMRQAACNQVLASSSCGQCCSTQLCNSNCNANATISSSSQVCMDDSTCLALKQTFEQNHKDICVEPSMKYFCNKTCSLCQSSSTTSTVITSPTTSPTSAMTSPTSAMTSPTTAMTSPTTATTSSTAVMTSPTSSMTSQTPTTLLVTSPSTTRQTTQADPCSSHPCIHGVCSVSGTLAVCTCATGYIGTMCDRTDPCAQLPCVHGVCSPLISGAFQCTCAHGFTGSLCDAAISPCVSNPCLHGTCRDTTSGYQCACLPGFLGHTCELPDPCTVSPCAHGVCTTLLNGTFQCTCHTGFSGVLCDQSLSPCTQNPCQHGTCVSAGSLATCTCKSGYVGAFCDRTDPCTISPCVHGFCTSSARGTFQCSCNSGFTGLLCDAAIHPCRNNPCVHGQCLETGVDYRCVCDHGYIGDLCDRHDPCMISPCTNGVCSTLQNGTFQCTCSTGFSGPLCDIVDACSLSPCKHGKCTNMANGVYQCVCDHGYIGSNCDRGDPCAISPCTHGACSSTQAGGFQCLCSAGYQGMLCDELIPPCHSSPCLHGACLNQGTSYVCNCDQGYIGTNCEKVLRDCKDVLDSGVSSNTGDDVYIIRLNASPVNVKCDMNNNGGGWTVLMNRESATLDFENQDYSSYASGFGDIRNDFWIGLENMNGLTKDGRRYQLRVELEVANGTKYYETYDDFSIGDPKDFVLHVGNYQGNAGDSLSGHNGFGFTTKNVDHDSNAGTNCADYLKGSWWFHNCFDSCLTCPYLTPGTELCRSFSWNSLGYCHSLKSARMMVRPM